jgi:5S rRNA maturation endonuclease (ribonuclease M5)
MKEAIQNHFQDNYRTFYEKYLQGIKEIGGDEYKARCPFPAHEDKNPSLTFNNQNGGYYCHGCGKKGGLFHFYGKMNSLDTRNDFGKILLGIADDFGIPWQEKKSRVAKTYDYVDPMGELLFQVCRMEPKDFRQRRPDGNGKWIWNLKGIQPVLYRLPAIMSASEIIIVEGEKDADAVASLGFCSTTCPMGAKKWKDHYSEALKGKHVVLIPDNDNEGREHMARVGASLNGIAASLKFIELPDLPSKGDVSDWIAKIGDKETAAERLAVMIEKSGPYKPPKQASIEDAILDDTEFHSVELPEKRSILEPWLKEQSIALIPGWRGVGKTWFAMGLVDAITRGDPFGPWGVVESVPCLYLEGEMPAQDIRERFYGLGNRPKRESRLYIYSDAYANHLGLPRANLLSEKWRTKMKSILTTRGIKLWVIDNIASLAGGMDENLKRDWDPVNAWLLELRFAGIATIMLHHTNKEGGQRGTSAREDNIDTTILLKHPHDYTPEDGARFIAGFKKARVRTANLPLIADTQFQLTEDQNGQLVWSWGNVRRQTKAEVLQMLDEGHAQKDIAELLGIHKGTVSKIRKTAINEGLITPDNKLKQSGFNEVFGDDD